MGSDARSQTRWMLKSLPLYIEDCGMRCASSQKMLISKQMWGPSTLLLLSILFLVSGDVSTIDVGPNDSIQSASNYTFGNVTLNVNRSNAHILFVGNQTVLDSAVMRFQGFASVEFRDILFQRSRDTILSFENVNRVTLSQCNINHTDHAFLSINGGFILSVHHCTFADITTSTGVITNIDFRSSSFSNINSKVEGGIISLESDTINVTFHDIIFDGLKNYDYPNDVFIAGGLQFNLPAIDTLLFDGCSFVNCEGTYGAPIKLSGGSYEKVIIRDSQFVSNVGLSHIYFDWYTTIGAVHMDNTTFTGLQSVSEIYLGLQLSSGVIISAGVIGSFNMNTITVLSCLMGPESAFLALMPTYNSPERPMVVGSVHIYNLEVSGNQLSSIFLDGGTIENVTVVDSTFEYNDALSQKNWVAGVMSSTQTMIIRNVRVVDCEFSFNTGLSGAVSIMGVIDDISFDHVTVTVNRANSDVGGGMMIYTKYPTRLVMRDMIFRGNSAASSGGALYLLNVATASIYNSTFFQNSLTNYQVNLQRGGAIFVDQSPATASLLFTDCTFSFNSGNMGAAIYTSVDTTFTGGSIGNHPVVQSSIYDVSSGLTFTGTSFSDRKFAAGSIIKSQRNLAGTTRYVFKKCTMTFGFSHSLNVPGIVGEYVFHHNRVSQVLSLNIPSSVVVDRFSYDNNVVEKDNIQEVVRSLAVNLQRLSLSGNHLNDVQLDGISLEKLIGLDLSHNKLKRIGTLDAPNLRELRASRNELLDMNFLENLREISHLNLSDNDIKQSLDLIYNLPNLQTLDLQRNRIHGNLTAIHSLKNLTTLLLSQNVISGEISSYVSDLTNLIVIDLSSNQMTGGVPLLKMPHLQLLNFSRNFISATSLVGLSRSYGLTVLDVSHNSINASLADLNDLSNLTEIRANHNQIGQFDLSFSKLKKLRFIDLQHNEMNDTIPQNFWSSESLAFADFSHNRLQSVDRIDEVNASSLTEFYLSRNRLNENILSTISQISSLTVLDLAYNDIVGDISPICSLSQMRFLDLSHNSIRGQLSCINQLAHLCSVNVSFNDLSGNLPEISNMSHLNIFSASHNHLTGNLTEMPSQMEIYNVSYNSITGGTLTSKDMRECDVSHNSMECPIHWNVSIHCATSCIITDLNNASVRLHMSGDISTFNETSFLHIISQVANVSQTRLHIFSITSGSVIVDLIVLPPLPSTLDEGSSSHVVEAIRSIAYGVWTDHGIDMIDIISPAPSSDTHSYSFHSSVSSSSTKVIHVETGGGRSMEWTPWMIAAVAIGGVFVITMFVFIFLFVAYKRRQRKRNEEEHNLLDREATDGSVYSIVDVTQLDKNTQLRTASSSEKNMVTLLQQLGEGAYGVVWKANYKGTIVAMKQIRTKGATIEAVENFMEEVELMKLMSPHQNVIQFLGFCHKPLSIITEFCGGGDLKTFLDDDTEISYEIRLDIIRGITAGMEHLASERIIHRDLAARNVLLTIDLVPKVSDFGLSRLLHEENTHQSRLDVGPIKWMSPESLKLSHFSEKSDVWSWAVLCIEVLTRREPLPNVSPSEYVVKFFSEGLNERMIDLVSDDQAHDALYDAIGRAFTVDPDNRPTFKDLRSLLRKPSDGEAPCYPEDHHAVNTSAFPLIFRLACQDGTQLLFVEMESAGTIERGDASAVTSDRPTRRAVMWFHALRSCTYKTAEFCGTDAGMSTEIRCVGLGRSIWPFRIQSMIGERWLNREALFKRKLEPRNLLFLPVKTEFLLKDASMPPEQLLFECARLRNFCLPTNHTDVVCHAQSANMSAGGWIRKASPDREQRDSQERRNSGVLLVLSVTLYTIPHTRKTPAANMDVVHLITSTESPHNSYRVEGLQRCMGRIYFFAPPKTRQDRKIFTYEQREELLREYKCQPYPTIHRRRELADKMNTSVRSIQIWFQNRRQRTDRMDKKRSL
ncbi:hypothetical protein PROFUN_04266 [Planoprotostelium fungivorum]|uniref:Leucine-rich repeat receptor-like protein kinase n=1 Tax=Planoprotostelium fungivorum TaxID=1890364 RepID=A0A2P6NV01_9EUKA|nr:hypothetical protein PROFUN_04266 [Planoprotostelium fungivorum]